MLSFKSINCEFCIAPPPQLGLKGSISDQLDDKCKSDPENRHLLTKNTFSEENEYFYHLKITITRPKKKMFIY